MASVLVPLFQTNIAASFGDYIFATDASDSKGAICSAGMDPQLQEVVFRACESKGSYTRLQRSEEVILRRIGAVEGFDEEPLPCNGRRRPIACRYQFLEIFAGAAVVTEAISKLGVVCGPPIELLDPPEFDMKSHHLMHWITRLSSVLRRIGSLMVAGGLYLCTPYMCPLA